MFLSGILGAIYYVIVNGVYSVNYFVCCMTIILFGLFGFTVTKFDLQRGVGLGLMAIGVVLVVGRD